MNPSQPLITFALISYHEERFIREAVEAAFAQTYQPLEIILSNDCSADRTFEIMTSMAARYRGPHRIVLNRNEKNLGTGGHVNRVMELAKGEIVVIAAADDVSLPGRTSRLSAIFKAGRGRIKSVFSNAFVVDEAGNGQTKQYTVPLPENEFDLARIVRRGDFGLVAGSSHAWTRDLFDFFGPLMTPLSVEDSPIAFRAALTGEIAFTDEVLIRHRRHDSNTWQYEGRDSWKALRYILSERGAVLRNWLRDVRTLQDRAPDRKQELAGYAEILGNRIDENAAEIVLYECSWIKRCVLILSMSMTGMPLRKTASRAGRFLVPGLYRLFLQVRHGLASRRNSKSEAIL